MSFGLSYDGAGRRGVRIAAVALVAALAICVRVFHEALGLPPNVELVTAAALFSALLLRRRAAALVPLVIAALSDAILGNTSLLLVTWSAWVVIGLGALAAPRLTDRTKPGTRWRPLATSLGFAVASTAFFYLWTNAGVWLQWRGDWLPAGITGLVESYVAALPFLRTQLLGNLVAVPLAAGLANLVAARLAPIGAARQAPARA